MQASDKDITLFAKTNFRNREVPFGIRRDDRRRHMYIIGKTGMGKTTLIENMVIQDILNGHGVAFVDPHGDSVEKVLNYIPSDRINDVIYLNPADVDFPIAFNPLEAVDPKHKHLVASGLMGVFTKIWAGVWSPRMEYILNNTILALLDSPGNTMLGIARMYVDKAYRKKIVDNIKDPVVKSFWVDEFANYQDKFRTEAVAPIQNKVGQFLSNAIIRNIVGQTKSSIDLREVMDNKKILLLNLSKGRIGEDSSALLGAMIITKLQLAAMSRVDIPEEERADFYLYVDEFQNFATESFANILSEARKYRLNLIVAHQYIGQLVQDKKNTMVRDAIFGNVGTMITFRVGADDAEFLEKEFEPTYTINDLVNLSKFSIYLKLMINGVASNPFSAGTLPPISEPTGNTEKVIRVSRERYATPRMTVEQKISKWLGAEFHLESAKVESDSMDEEGVADELRFKHEKTASKTIPPTQVRNFTPPRPIKSQFASPAAATTQKSPSDDTPAPQKPAPTGVDQVIPSAPPESELELQEPSGQKEFSSKPSEPAPQPYKPPILNIPTPHSKMPRQEGKKPEERKPQPSSEDRRQPEERRRLERRVSSHGQNLDRRATDKKPKHENPIWETVTKMTSEKIKESSNRANQALEALSKSLQQSVVKNPPPAPAPKIKPPELVQVPKLEKKPQKTVANPAQSKSDNTPPPPIEVHPPFPVSSIKKEKVDLGHLGDPELPEHDLHPEDHTLSPHHNIQDTIAKHGALEPGESVKFD